MVHSRGGHESRGCRAEMERLFLANKNIFTTAEHGITKVAVQGHTFYQLEEGVEQSKQLEQTQRQWNFEEEPLRQNVFAAHFEQFWWRRVCGRLRVLHS